MHPDRDGEVGDDCIDGSILDQKTHQFEPQDVNPGIEECYGDGDQIATSPPRIVIKMVTVRFSMARDNEPPRR